MQNKINVADILKHLINNNSTEDLFSYFYSFIDYHQKIDGKMFLLINETNRIRIYNASFPENIGDLNKAITSWSIKISNYETLSRCIESKKIIKINKNNLKTMDDFIQKRFEFYSIDNAVLFPFGMKDKEPLGILFIYNENEAISKETIDYIKQTIDYMYYFVHNKLEIEKLYKITSEYKNSLNKYQRLIKHSADINRLTSPEKLYSFLIDTFIEVFGFEFGFVQLAKENKLPIIGGSAINDELLKLLNENVKYWGDMDNAPIYTTPPGPEMACCFSFINNSSYYIPDAQIFSMENPNLKMSKKDKIAFKIFNRQLKTVLQIPIRDENEAIGVIQLINFSTPVILTENDIEIIINMCSFIPSILKNIGIFNKVEKQNNLIKEELMLAKQIQREILPKAFPSIEGINGAFFYQPMEDIGGDLYDFIFMREESILGIFISDVSGHGTPAALITSMVKTLLDTAGSQRIAPDRLLNYINEKLCSLTGGNFLTAFYGIYDTKSKSLVFCKAAHEAPFLIRDNEIIRLEAKGRVLGIFDSIEFQVVNVNLKKGDRIFLFTDGLTDARNGKGEYFDEIIADLLIKYANKPVDSFIQCIDNELNDFINDFPLEDDICMIAIDIE